MATGEPNAATSGEPAVPLSRWKRVLGYIVCGVMIAALCLELALALLPLFIEPNAIVDRAFAATNFVCCGFALYLFLYSLLHSLPRRGDQLREWWARLTQAAICVLFTAIAYDSLAHLLPAGSLPMLDQLPPGLMSIWHSVLEPLALAFLVVTLLRDALAPNRHRST